MTDSCKHCTVRGDIKLCVTTPCNTHVSWYAQQQQAEIERLRELLRETTEDLSYSIANAYPLEMRRYPNEMRRYESEMEIVHRARAALAKEDKP